MTAPARLTNVLVNEWGEPEPTPAQETFAEDVGIYAGCPDTSCDELTICFPCGQPVCLEHTHGVLECVEAGPHHKDCWTNCGPCVDDAAREMADEHVEDIARYGR